MSESNTDNDILSNIPDFMGNDDATTQGDPTQAETAEQSVPASGTDANKPAATTAEPAARGEGNSQAAQPAAPTTRRDGFIEVPNKDNPNTKDIVDPATGQIVAAGGRERATWERAQRLHHDARTAQQQRAQFEQRALVAEAKVQSSQEISQLLTSSGVDHTGHKIAVQLMGRFLKDPVGVLTDMVSEVKAKGYAIPFLESGVTPGMDAQAMSMMLDQRLAPFTHQRQQQEEQQRVASEAKSTLDNFLAAEPDALHNIGIIGEMLTQDPSLNGNLHLAWSKLIRMSYEAGLNPAQPLGPQYQAKMQQQTTQPQPGSPNGAIPPAKPLPHGRQPSNTVPVAAAKQFDENSSWSDIIRQGMRESGLT